MHSLSIIIPAYNEQENIEAGKLLQVAGWLKSYPAPSELLVVDDGSTDRTAESAKHAAAAVISIVHSGKAAALIAGMKSAACDHLLFLDMDQATPISEASKLLDILENSADIVIGSRGLLRRYAPWNRYLLSLGHVILQRLLLWMQLPFVDTQCGFKACRREAALEILDHLKLYSSARLAPASGSRVNSGFDAEFLLVGLCRGFRIVEVPVDWNYHRTRRANLLNEVWHGLRDLVMICWQEKKGDYEPEQADTAGLK